MPEEFDFELSDKLKKDFPNEPHYYHAKQISPETYEISWIEDGNPDTTTFYDTKEVEDAIYNGAWIVKE